MKKIMMLSLLLVQLHIFGAEAQLRGDDENIRLIDSPYLAAAVCWSAGFTPEDRDSAKNETIETLIKAPLSLMKKLKYSAVIHEDFFSKEDERPRQASFQRVSLEKDAEELEKVREEYDIPRSNVFSSGVVIGLNFLSRLNADLCLSYKKDTQDEIERVRNFLLFKSSADVATIKDQVGHVATLFYDSDDNIVTLRTQLTQEEQKQVRTKYKDINGSLLVWKIAREILINGQKDPKKQYAVMEYSEIEGEMSSSPLFSYLKSVPVGSRDFITFFLTMAPQGDVKAYRQCGSADLNEEVHYIKRENSLVASFCAPHFIKKEDGTFDIGKSGLDLPLSISYYDYKKGEVGDDIRRGDAMIKEIAVKEALAKQQADRQMKSLEDNKVQ
ncbi:hypothetical protein K9K77_00680 [Candidatus Babeliales bacterium]|nr:hypothetical protein [Candidatus Babeliales bacterium]